MIHKFTILFISIFVLIGCSSQPKIDIDKRPKMQIAKKSNLL